jgi:UDP-glucose 4-epimerase
MNRILLTGASGFVGARVARLLVEQGRDVALLLRASSDTRRIDDLLARCTVIRGDMDELEAVRAPTEAFRPAATIHIAWGGVQGADRDSQVHLRNVSSSIALYEMTQALGAGRFVGLGSQAEYGPLPGRISESAVARPTHCYGAAKLATALVLERSAAASGRGFAWLRLFSSYGPGDDPTWLLPYLTRTLMAGEKPKVTRAEQVWDYIHVDDVARGIVAAVDARPNGIFNLGSGRALRLRHIIEILRDLIDPALPIGFGEIDYRADQVMHLEADTSALQAATGWVPKVSIEDGLAELVAHARRMQPVHAAAAATLSANSSEPLFT